MVSLALMLAFNDKFLVEFIVIVRKGFYISIIELQPGLSYLSFTLGHLD
jgi:hypothetical protein